MCQFGGIQSLGVNRRVIDILNDSDNIKNKMIGSHVDQFICSFKGCNKLFANKYSLKRHVTTHDPEKKHVCEECGKRFSLPQYLKEHTIVHTKSRPFICTYPGCDKTFR